MTKLTGDELTEIARRAAADDEELDAAIEAGTDRQLLERRRLERLEKKVQAQEAELARLRRPTRSGPDEQRYREEIACTVEGYALRVERMCPGLQRARDGLVVAHDHADQQMWGGRLPWPALLMVAMLPASWRDQFVSWIAAATHQSDPRRLTLRPGNWVRLTDEVVAHLQIQVGDVVVAGLQPDRRVELQSLDDWFDETK